MRIFLDTSVVAVALATRGLCNELFEVTLQSHELFIADSVIKELERVLPNKLGQSNSVTAEFIALLRSVGILVIIERTTPSLPDSDDEPIIAAALSGKSDVFVTGDKALLELRSIEGMPVISPRGLREALAGLD